METASLIQASFSEIDSTHLDKIPSIGAEVLIPSFDQDLLIDLCNATISQLVEEPILVSLKGELIIVGDIHGNFHDLIRIFGAFGSPPKTSYLFLGDYVDRGDYSTEVIAYLLSLLILYPNHVTLLRGNHEFPEINGSYGFKEELNQTYQSEVLWRLFNDVFSYLPLAAIVNDTTFCIHGGLAEGFEEIAQVSCLKKPITSSDIPPIVYRLLWSDPANMNQPYASNERGTGDFFGSSAFHEFCQHSGMKVLIRAHQCVEKGYLIMFEKCITVFSSSGYKTGNTAAVLSIESDGSFKAIQFPPITKPTRKQATFYSINKPKKETFLTTKSKAMKSSLRSGMSFYKLGQRHRSFANLNPPIPDNFKESHTKGSFINLIHHRYSTDDDRSPLYLTPINETPKPQGRKLSAPMVSYTFADNHSE